MLNNDEPAKKRSKLVLPEPQINDEGKNTGCFNTEYTSLNQN